jgi:hypothetical protein
VRTHGSAAIYALLVISFILSASVVLTAAATLGSPVTQATDDHSTRFLAEAAGELVIEDAPPTSDYHHTLIRPVVSALPSRTLHRDQRANPSSRIGSCLLSRRALHSAEADQHTAVDEHANFHRATDPHTHSSGLLSMRGQHQFPAVLRGPGRILRQLRCDAKFFLRSRRALHSLRSLTMRTLHGSRSPTSRAPIRFFRVLHGSPRSATTYAPFPVAFGWLSLVVRATRYWMPDRPGAASAPSGGS